MICYKNLVLRSAGFCTKVETPIFIHTHTHWGNGCGTTFAPQPHCWLEVRRPNLSSPLVWYHVTSGKIRWNNVDIPVVTCWYYRGTTAWIPWDNVGSTSRAKQYNPLPIIVPGAGELILFASYCIQGHRLHRAWDGRRPKTLVSSMMSPVSLLWPGGTPDLQKFFTSGLSPFCRQSLEDDYLSNKALFFNVM